MWNEGFQNFHFKRGYGARKVKKWPFFWHSQLWPTKSIFFSMKIFISYYSIWSGYSSGLKNGMYHLCEPIFKGARRKNVKNRILENRLFLTSFFRFPRFYVSYDMFSTFIHFQYLFYRLWRVQRYQNRFADIAMTASKASRTLAI